MNLNDLKRLAKRTGFDVVTLEKDYAITWLLSGLYSQESTLKDILVFKGGTAIRKVYFPEWRLSEDLDFTVAKGITTENALRKGFDKSLRMLQESKIKFSVVDFNNTKQGIFVNVQFVGPMQYKNKISHDISLTEKILEQPVKMIIKSEYSDIPDFEITVYSINEIVAEKVRSLIQRAKARDYYDVWRLLKDKNLHMEVIKALILQKCEAEGVAYRPDLIFDTSRLSEAEKYWLIALSRLTDNLPQFKEVVGYLQNAFEKYGMISTNP
jgi:predicted nucleotidyltransferase component of viral defense system